MVRRRRGEVGFVPCYKGAILIVTKFCKSLAKCSWKSDAFKSISLYGKVKINGYTIHSYADFQHLVVFRHRPFLKDSSDLFFRIENCFATLIFFVFIQRSNH
jgi:hypothetical protein